MASSENSDMVATEHLPLNSVFHVEESSATPTPDESESSNSEEDNIVTPSVSTVTLSLVTPPLPIKEQVEPEGIDDTPFSQPMYFPSSYVVANSPPQSSGVVERLSMTARSSSSDYSTKRSIRSLTGNGARHRSNSDGHVVYNLQRDEQRPLLPGSRDSERSEASRAHHPELWDLISIRTISSVNTVLDHDPALTLEEDNAERQPPSTSSPTKTRFRMVRRLTSWSMRSNNRNASGFNHDGQSDFSGTDSAIIEESEAEEESDSHDGDTTIMQRRRKSLTRKYQEINLHLLFGLHKLKCRIKERMTIKRSNST